MPLYHTTTAQFSPDHAYLGRDRNNPHQSQRNLVSNHCIVDACNFAIFTCNAFQLRTRFNVSILPARKVDLALNVVGRRPSKLGLCNMKCVELRGRKANSPRPPASQPTSCKKRYKEKEIREENTSFHHSWVWGLDWASRYRNLKKNQINHSIVIKMDAAISDNREIQEGKDPHAFKMCDDDGRGRRSRSRSRTWTPTLDGTRREERTFWPWVGSDKTCQRGDRIL